ncbi:MAG: OmpA family protein, partial [Candidatus Latescibacteria bacterium]|nr:OmpA family protein [Candidatus Latescibacterota bacterium]
MRHAIKAALLVAAIALASPLTSFSEESPVWLAPGGGIAWIPNELGVKAARPRVGGILGVRLSPQWALEAHGSYMKSPSETAGAPSLYLPHLEGNFTWFPGGDKPFSPYLTAGAGVAYFKLEGATGGKKRFDYGGGGGIRAKVGEKLSLRIEARDIRYKVALPGSAAEEYRNHAEANAGLSYGFGGAPKDLDRDLVPDKMDRCPGTPAGARVDALGCPIDGDGDGVYDGIDACEGTPQGATVDARGCPMDQDGDKVWDGIDRCADTPSGATVDANGCPLDSDGDGVWDGTDQCAGTPTGCRVNPNGCQTDSDQDGVCDGLDQCPDTPETAKVDRGGCPIVVNEKETQLLETGMIRLQNVNFDTGKATIRPESQGALNEVGNILARWPDLRIEIGGHTDSRGGAQRNLELSRSRAQAVLDYLLDRFPELDPKQFTAAGYGLTRPIADNGTELGRAQNRRVEFKVLNKEALRREKQQQKLIPRE